MACKLRCPQCRLVLKEKGDEGKRSQGVYIVHPQKDHNIVECCECGLKAKAIEYLDD